MTQPKQNSPVEAGIKISSLNDGVGIEWCDGRNTLQFTHSYDHPGFYRRINATGQSIIKACSNKQRSIHSVLDLTGGWGIDSFILAHSGKQVTMLEQSHIVHSVIAQSLKNALKNSSLSDTVNRIKLQNINSLDYLSSTDSSTRYDCIYLDPMFPAHKSTAKPAKDMQLLQKLTENVDIEACFELALTRATNRVVVKRPLKSTPMTVRQPDLIYREKTVRFDVYLTADGRI
ncbi:MAG: class I SAM-dependent methyltransferase [Gammaproteobacteria bacterium]|nr:class I SAM-dependent methyltransferase [Gammaproteobacteria bacterium]